jgi:hypothetical protein
MSAQNEDLGPGLAPAIFLGILTFVIGAVLGTVSMISQPVTPMTKTASLADLEPGTVIYIKGDRAGRTSWEAKEEAWKAGTVNVLTVSEQELNQWSAKSLQPGTPPEPPEGASWMDKLDLSVVPVNFRILEDKVHLATEVKVPGLLGDKSFIYQISGDFVPTEGGVRFKPSSGTLGCAPLGDLPGIKGVLFSYISSLYMSAEAGDWLAGSLEGLDSAVISEGQLVLKRG